MEALIDKRISDAMTSALMPPPRLSTHDWLCENMILPITSPRPGKYSTDLTPYVAGVYDAFDDPKCEAIVLAWGTQTSKTQTMIGMLMAIIGNTPGNTIFSMPNSDLAESFSKTRFTPIAEASPAVAAKLPTERGKGNVDEKIFTDMLLNFIGGNSATQLSSRSAANIFMDEVDKYPRTLTKEACPIELLRERQRWYRGKKKLVLGSTPVFKDHKIWPWMERGSYDKLFWPCPHCEKAFCPTWKMMKWDNSDELTNEQKAAGSYIECPNCGGKFEERHKRKALAAAKWISTNPEQRRIRSFHLTEMQTQLSTFRDMVLYFLEAVETAKNGDMGKLQNFVNSKLAEPWEDSFGGKRDISEMEQLMDGRERGVIPDEAIAIVAGVDTQHDGFWYVVRAHGKNNESWLIREGYVTSFEELDEVIFGEMKDKSGRHRETDFCLIDSQGHRMNEVHAWSLRQGQYRVMPIIGKRLMDTPFKFKAIEERGYGHMQRVFVNTTYFKDILNRKLRTNIDDPGAFRLHSQTSSHYKAQMTAEFRDPSGVWQCPKHIPNHLWDCEVYSWCAAAIRDVWNWPHPYTPEEVEKREIQNSKSKEESPLW